VKQARTAPEARVELSARSARLARELRYREGERSDSKSRPSDHTVRIALHIIPAA
jgi:hypothetical protein